MNAPVPSSPTALAIITAVVCALTATTCYNLGPAIQKESLNRFPPLTSQSLLEQVRIAFGDRRWRVGLLLGLSGVLPNLAAVSLIGMAASQPLMGFGLVVLAWYGTRRLGERLPPRAVVGIMLMITLPALIAFSRVSSPTRTVLEPATRHILAAALGVVFALCGTFALLSRRASILLAPAAGMLLSMTAFCLQVISQLFASTGHRLVRDLRAILAALFAEPAYLLILGVTAVGSALSVIAYYLQQIGLQRNRATRFNPILNSVSMAAGVSLGIVVFGQKVGRPALYLAAMAVAVVAISLLSSSREPAPCPAGGRASGDPPVTPP
jgi:hypothetical protein